MAYAPAHSLLCRLSTLARQLWALFDRSTAVHDETRAAATDGEATAETDAELDGVFDFAWARSSPTHELSAHGRSVQQRLDSPAPKPPRPSFWKRLRFALYRMRSGR